VEVRPHLGLVKRIVVTFIQDDHPDIRKGVNNALRGPMTMENAPERALRQVS
jgi:hypothetical protein